MPCPVACTAAIFDRFTRMEEKAQSYLELLGFLLLMGLFCTVLYLQADSSQAYDFASSHNYLLPQVSGKGSSGGQNAVPRN